MKVIQ
jgi:propionyl-CoA carboxylase beta chain